MASEKQLHELHLSLGLSVGGSSRRMPPSLDGANGGPRSSNLVMEDGEAGHVDLERRTGIGASPAVACSTDVLEAQKWSFGSILRGTGNPLMAPVRYPLHQQVMYVPAIDGFGIPSVIPSWAPAVLPAGGGLDQPVACMWSRTAGKGVSVMPMRDYSTGNSSSGIPVRRTGFKQVRNKSKIWSSSSSDVRGKSLHISEKPLSQEITSVSVQISHTKLASRILASDMSSASVIPLLKGSNSMNKHIVAIKEQDQSPLPQMPCVAATGDGPNGKGITGVLYKYGHFEEVTIVCVCHGISFSPAEFVRHAGCIETAHPLRQIFVVPS